MKKIVLYALALLTTISFCLFAQDNSRPQVRLADHLHLRAPELFLQAHASKSSLWARSSSALTAFDRLFKNDRISKSIAQIAATGYKSHKHLFQKKATAVAYEKELEGESLLSLLIDLNDDHFSILQAKAQRLLEQNPKWVVDQIRSTLHSKSDTDALIRLLDENEKSPMVIGDCIAHNFDALAATPEGHYFLQTLIEKKNHNSILVEKIIIPSLRFAFDKPSSEASADTITTVFLPHKHYGPLVVKELAKAQEKNEHSLPKHLLKAMFIDQPHEFLEQFIKNEKCLFNDAVLNFKFTKLSDFEVFDKWKKSVDLTSRFLRDHFDQMIKTPKGVSLAIRLASLRYSWPLDQALLDLLYESNEDVIKHATLESLASLREVVERYPAQYSQLKEKLVCLLRPSVHNLIGAAEGESLQQAESSPTIQHLLVHGADTTVIRYNNSPQLRTLTHQVIEKERQLNKAGYFTFVHGQRWQYQLAEDWFTKLWNVTHAQHVDDFIFAHVKKIPHDAQKEDVLRNSILKKGRSGGWFNNNSTERQRMLFMNAGLFYNSQNKVSNTAYYVSKNDNINTHIQLSLHDAFKIHRLETVFNTYKNELLELQNEHAQLSTYGNLLLVAVPEETVNQAVFVAQPGGYKKKVTIKGVGQTDDTKLILNTLRTNPEKIEYFDFNEFCLIMTADKQGGLNPESGIKFFQFNTVDPQRWKEFKEKEQALFERIAQEIQAQAGQPANNPAQGH